MSQIYLMLIKNKCILLCKKHNNPLLKNISFWTKRWLIWWNQNLVCVALRFDFLFFMLLFFMFTGMLSGTKVDCCLANKNLIFCLRFALIFACRLICIYTHWQLRILKFQDSVYLKSEQCLHKRVKKKKKCCSVTM